MNQSGYDKETTEQEWAKLKARTNIPPGMPWFYPYLRPPKWYSISGVEKTDQTVSNPQ